MVEELVPGCAKREKITKGSRGFLSVFVKIMFVRVALDF